MHYQPWLTRSTPMVRWQKRGGGRRCGVSAFLFRLAGQWGCETYSTYTYVTYVGAALLLPAGVEPR